MISQLEKLSDDTSLFSPITNPILCSNILNNDLVRISEWAFVNGKCNLTQIQRNKRLKFVSLKNKKAHYYKT